jgi:hypothetical protein
MGANASRYHGKAPDELDWTNAQRQKRAVAEYLAGLEAEAQVQHGGIPAVGGTPTAKLDRKPPKVNRNAAPVCPTPTMRMPFAPAKAHVGQRSNRRLQLSIRKPRQRD